MTAGRKPTTKSVTIHPETVAGVTMAQQAMVAADIASADQLTALQTEAEGNAAALAKQIGYEGSLTVGSLEDGIRFYQRRTGEDCVEMGKRLLLLREITPHGEFQQRLELLAIEKRMAQRFMEVSLRFSKAATSPLLKAANSQSKMLELLVLDDEEIDTLENGESARGITLEKIETMSVRELRAALRKAESVSEAKDRLLMGKEAKINELAKSLALAGRATPDEALAKIRHEVAKRALDAETTLENSLRPAVRALMEHHAANGGDSHEVLDGYLLQLERVITETRQEFGIDGGRAPSWVNAE